MSYTIESKSKPTVQYKNTTAIIIPAIVFIIILMLLAYGLTRDPRIIPSPLIGKPAPEFNLPPLPGRSPGFSTADLKDKVSLVNVFASWCVACRQEHPLFMQLKKDALLPIYGINYRDRPQDAIDWLDELGDPYTQIGVDRKGLVSIDWGVYGVPETFLIDRQGRIAYKIIGAVTPDILKNKLLPLIKELQQ